ncbi:retrovirus-related pol polyprotein from transposon TNT 1-94 [Tanacetum coccineum]
MMLLARAISRKFSPPTNNRLRMSSNIKNQVVVQDGRVDIQTKNAGYGGIANKNMGKNKNQMFNAGNASNESNQIVQCIPRTDSTPSKVNVQCYNCNEKGHYARDCQKPKVFDAKYFSEQMLLAMKDEAGSHLSNEENDFMLDNAYGEESLDELTTSVHDSSKAHEQVSHVTRKTIIQTTDDDQIDSSIIFDDPYVDNNGGTSKHDSIAHEENHEIQMLAYTVQPGLGYQNPERLKKAIVAQPKMYDGDMLYSEKLIINSPDSEETLEDAEESDALTGFYTKINKTLLKDVERRWLSNSQNELREFYKTDVIPTSRSLYKNLKDIKEELIAEVDRLLEVSLTSEIRDCVLLSAAQQKHDLLKDELEKSSKDFKEIQANLLNRIKVLENDFQRSQAQSIDFELKLQHQKEKMACDVPWKSKLSTLNSENVLFKGQVESDVQERENIKLEFQKLFNSIKVTRDQHQKEVDELIQCVTQKTYAYGDVRAENQDLLMTISELKSKLSTIKKGKNVNTKFDSSETLGKRVCVTPFNKQIADKAMNASKTKVNLDRSKPVTSQSTPEQGQKHNENVITRGMYKINKQDMKTPGSKPNTKFSNFTGVGSSHSVKRSTSKDIKSKNSILKNTKSSSTYMWKTLNSACLDSNKSDTKTSNVCQTNACISNSKTVKACVNVVKDVMNEVADEFVQEDVANFDGNMFHNAPQTLEFEVAESSSTYQDPSNVH